LKGTKKTEIWKYWVWTMWQMLQHFPQILPEPPFGYMTVCSVTLSWRWQYKSRAIPASFFEQLFSFRTPFCSSINCPTSGEEVEPLKKLFVAISSMQSMHTSLLDLGWTNFLLGQTVQQMWWLCWTVVCIIIS
jgi:hypothetical protein